MRWKMLWRCCVWAALGLTGAVSLAPGAMAAPASVGQAAAPRPACPTLLQHRFARLQDEAPQELCQYAGKVLLVVNTASYCGFTNQYQGLEELYARHATRGFVVLGFPSNDFGQQEPGNNRQIADFCFNTYGVKFPMFSKTVVSGKDANALFSALAKATGQPPTWNFHKYLIDRKGRVLASYPGEVAPTDAALRSQLQKALADR